MSQLVCIVDREVESRKEILSAIQKARGERKLEIKVINNQPEIIRNSSFGQEYHHLSLHQTRKRTKTRLKLTKDELEIEQETEEVSRELDIIEDTIRYNLNQRYEMPEQGAVYRQIASYRVEEKSVTTTYQLFEANYDIPQVDVTHQVPNKMMDKLDLPPGLYGFTYLGTNYMAINSSLDLNPAKKEETMLHEAIHTPDEYETRVLTQWMMSKDKKYAVVAKREQKLY